jgi:hypothetical protein
MRSVASARGARRVERMVRNGTRRAERIRREERVVRVTRAVQLHESQHAGSHAGAEAAADELQELGLQAVAVREMREASRRHAPRVGRLREPQPSRHHGVDPVASDQHLQVQQSASCSVFSFEAPAMVSFCRAIFTFDLRVEPSARCRILTPPPSSMDMYNPGGEADGASWQLLLQGLQLRVPPDAADLIGP